jgi:hypothetical protein
MARMADEVVELAERSAGKLSRAVSGDARASAELARAAAAVAHGLAALNRAGS